MHQHARIDAILRVVLFGVHESVGLPLFSVPPESNRNIGVGWGVIGF